MSLCLCSVKCLQHHKMLDNHFSLPLNTAFRPKLIALILENKHDPLRRRSSWKVGVLEEAWPGGEGSRQWPTRGLSLICSAPGACSIFFLQFKSWKWIKIVFQAFCQRSDKYNGCWLWWRRGGVQVGQPTSRSTWIRNACQGEIRACDGRPRLREETSARAAWGGPRADHGPQEAAGEEGEDY